MTISPKMKQLVGKATAPRAIEVEKGQVRRFARAIGEAAAIHFDEAAARAAGFPSLVAPPTFATALIDPEAFLDELGWDLQSVMHRAEEFEYFRPVCAGDVLDVTHRLADLYEQAGAGGQSLVFAIVETRIADSRSRPVLKGRRVLVKLKS